MLFKYDFVLCRSMLQVTQVPIECMDGELTYTLVSITEIQVQ